MNTRAAQNKPLVLEAFDTLFNKRDYASAEKFWSPHYIQHSAHIEPGREGLFNLVQTLPPTLRYEPGAIVADGDFVIDRRGPIVISSADNPVSFNDKIAIATDTNPLSPNFGNLYVSWTLFTGNPTLNFGEAPVF